MDARAWRSKKTCEADLLAAVEQGSPRKLRLFSCACARIVAPAVKGLDTARLIELGEQIADRDPDAPEPPDWQKQYRKVCSHRQGSYGLQDHYARVFEAVVGLDPRKDAWEAMTHTT